MAPRRGLLTALAALVAALLPAPIATDGDFDVFVGLDDGTIKYMLNGGTRSFMTLTEQTTAATHPLYGEDVGAEAMLSCVDIDADLDVDCFVGNNAGNIKYYRNINNPTLAMYTEQTASQNHPLHGVDVGDKAAPFCERDFDGDGDYDCFIGTSDGSIKYYKNTGTATAPAFTEQTGANNPLNGEDVRTNAVLFCADFDRDNDFDCFIGEGGGSIKYYLNTGTAAAPVFTEKTGTDNPFNGVSCGTNCVPRCFDFDYDDDIDCFIGTGAGTVLLYKNVGANTSPSFTLISTATNPFNGLDFGTNACPMFVDLDAECTMHNSCNGHGTCYPPHQCKCFDGYGSDDDISFYKAPDCSKRACPAGKAWADIPTSANTAHVLAECSDKGTCDRTSGKCACYPGFTGDACQRLACPSTTTDSECSGHGTCHSMKHLATMTNALPLSAATTYGGVYDSTTTWDSEMSFGCVCDSEWTVALASGERQQPQWFGHDCSLVRCPTGDDPGTTADETDCSGKAAAGGYGTGASGNKCHVDCSNKGVCDHKTGTCTCYPGYYSENCGKTSALAVGEAGA